MSDMAEAARHWQRVRELAGGLAESREGLELRVTAGIRQLSFAWRSGMLPAEAKALYTEGRELAERLGDRRAEAALLNMYGIVVGMSGDVSGGLALVSEGARLAREAGDAGLKLATAVALVQGQTMIGALHAAETALAESLETEPDDLGLGVAGTGFSPYLYLLMMRGHVRTEMGRLGEAESDLARVLALAGERGEVELLGWAHEFAAYLCLAIGRWEHALEHARHSLDRADRIGSPLSRSSAYYTMGAARLARGEFEEAAAAAERGLRIIRARGTGRHWESRGLAILAEALARAGEPTRARAALEEAEAFSLRGGNRAFECVSCLAIVRARRCIDAIAARAAIEATLARIDAIVAATGARLYVPSVHEERAGLAQALGDAEAWRRELVAARDLFAAMGADAHAARVAGQLAGAGG
jgi:tetratricopeptide (TPR) repeat protein